MARGRVGERGKPGSKARRNFQQSRSLCSRVAKGVPSHVYNVPLTNPVRFLFFAALTHWLRTCRKNSIAGKPLRAPFPRAPLFVFFVRRCVSFDCHSHGSTLMGVITKPCISIFNTVALFHSTNLTRVIFAGFACISLDRSIRWFQIIASPYRTKIFPL